jgi:hypothetical protein
MDQLRTALGWLKRQHFWVLSGLAALIALGCWWSGTGSFSKQFNTNQSTIKAEFDNLQSVKSASFHPNEAINERQATETKTQTAGVTKLWDLLYERQRENVLKWPAQLSKAFRDAVEKMQFGDEIETELRNNYQNYIEQHFPELPKQIGARELLPNETGGVGGEGRGRMMFSEAGGIDPALDDDNYICEWVDQDVIRKDLDFPQRPRALRIWKTQEDLWVYHTLLNVIAKTNQAAGATRKSNAAVKVVFSLEVGQRAAFSSRTPGRLLVQPAMAAPAAPGMEGAEGPAPPGGGPEAAARGMPGRGMMMESRGGGEFGTGGVMSEADEQRFLMSDRYLDEKGLPIPVGGGAAAGGEAAAPDQTAVADPNAVAPPLDMAQFGVCFKRLPVRMVLEMDTRWLPQLMTNCANEPLRVEVQEVRINTSDIAGLVAGGAAAGGMFRGGGERGFSGGAAGANLFPDRTGIQLFPQQPNVVTVAVQGIIYIYNKPNPALLQSPAGEAESPPVAAVN